MCGSIHVNMNRKGFCGLLLLLLLLLLGVITVIIHFIISLFYGLCIYLFIVVLNVFFYSCNRL